MPCHCRQWTRRSIIWGLSQFYRREDSHSIWPVRVRSVSTTHSQRWDLPVSTSSMHSHSLTKGQRLTWHPVRAYDNYHKLITQILGWRSSWLKRDCSGWHLSRLRMLISVEQVSRCFSWKTHKTAFASKGWEMQQLENHQRVEELKILPWRVGRDQKRRHANCKWFAHQTVLSMLFLLSTKLRQE